MNAVLGLNYFVRNLHRTELGFEGRVMNAVLGLNHFVRDLHRTELGFEGIEL